MGFLKRLGFGRNDPPAPDWAAFMKPAEYADFRGRVDAWLSSHGYRVEDIPGGVKTTRDDGEENTLGLSNLAQVCHQLPRGAWDEHIAKHFGLLHAIATVANPTPDDVRAMVKVRIYPSDFFEDAPESQAPVRRPLAPGIDAVLVLDYPDMIRTLEADTLGESGLSVDEAFDLGLANVRAQGLPEAIPSAEGGLVMLVGDDFFTTTWLLLLTEWFSAPLPNGAIVAVPNRHTLVVDPLTDASVIQHIGGLIQAVARDFNQGPGSISPSIYWWRPGGSLTLLPSETGRRPTFMPPDEFMEMLNTLAAPAG